MDFEFLNSKFHTKLYALIDKCNAHNIVLEFNIGFVSVYDQAIQWKQSRSDCEIDKKINELQADGMPFIARVLMDTNGATGEFITNDLPGFSWNNWGQAYTFAILGEDNKPLLDNDKSYCTISNLAKECGIITGYNFKPKQPKVIQLSPYKSPANIYSPQEIDKEMERMYGNN